MNLIRIATLGLVGYLAWKLRGENAVRPEPAAFAPGEAIPGNVTQVRTAGTAGMRSDPPEWDAVDEASDASFPASDPPAH